MQNYKYEKFVLKPVTTLPYYINYILGFIIGVPLFFIYREIGFRYSKTLVVYFDQVFLYIEDNKKKIKKYKKTDISGLYIYNYERIEKAFISIQIKLNNGKNINLTDTSTSQTIDKEKLLRRFLITAKKELNFSLLNKNSLRSIQKLGACWYSKV